LDWGAARPLQTLPPDLHFPAALSLPYTHYSLIEQSLRLLNETFNWEKDKRFRNYC
jgi:hypothetical protein